MDYQWKDENEYKKYSKPFSQVLLSYENYWKFALLYLIMKHCHRKIWGANYKIDETVKEAIFQLFGIELQGICCGRDKVKIWCNSVPYILWGRKGKPLMGGIHSGDVWSIL